MKIILIGFMGSGKTSVAKKLGSLLQLPIIEMDELVLKKTNSISMHEVFVKGGELLLRETEIIIAKETAHNNQTIISTGGGVVLNKIIFDYFKSNKCKIFFLNTSFQTLTVRLSNDSTRPLFQNIHEAETAYHFRQPLYLKCADVIIDTDNRSVEDIAKEITENHAKG